MKTNNILENSMLKAEIVEGVDRRGIKKFDSVHEAVVASRKCSSVNLDSWDRHLNYIDKNGDWLGVVGTGEDVSKLIDTGWDDGVKRMLESFKDISVSAKPMSVRRRKSRGDQGDEIDMQAVYAGNLPKAWSRTSRLMRPAVKNVTILCDLATSWSTPAEVMFWRGAAVLFLSDQLSASGFNVSIIGTDSAVLSLVSLEGKKDKPKAATLITIKRSDMPMDMSSIASSICLGGFLRTVCFGIKLGHSEALTSGISQACPFQELYPKEFSEMNAVADVTSINDKYTAIDWINRQTAKVTGM